MKKKIFALLLTTVFAFTAVACSNQKAAPDMKDKEPANTENVEKKVVSLNVSAAASLKDALEKINENYKNETGNEVVLNLGGSGKLVKQIQEGAPTDLFISASKKAMKQLVDDKSVKEENVSNLLENDLVMIVPKENMAKIEKIADLQKVDGKIAIGEVESVPAGQYAKESLEKLGLWDKIQDKLVFAKDVRSVLSYVEKGEVVAGFVYSSDAVVSENSTVAEVVPSDAHKSIVYPIAVLENSTQKEEIKKYEEYVKSEASLKIFEEFGFKVAK